MVGYCGIRLISIRGRRLRETDLLFYFRNGIIKKYYDPFDRLRVMLSNIET